MKAYESTVPVIPLVDFGHYLNGSEEERRCSIQQIADACSEVSCFYLINCGVSSDELQRVYDYTKKFFALPIEAKRRIQEETAENYLRRGYIGMYEEMVSDGGDVKEAFDIWTELSDDSPGASNSAAPNKWPVELPGMKECIQDSFLAKMIDVTERLIEAVAITLAIPVERFVPSVKKPDFSFRCVYYPPIVMLTEKDSKQMSCGEHCDENCLSLIYQPDEYGLEVKDARDDKWHVVPPIKDAFVVIIGETLHRQSNGKYQALRHRVIPPPDIPRYSFGVFFQSFDSARPVEPLTDGEEPHFEPIETFEMYKSKHAYFFKMPSK